MKKIIVFIIAMFIIGSAVQAEGPAVKGTDVYACDCEEGCPCPSPFLEPGTCDCGLEFAKMRVLKIDGGTAHLCKCDDDKCPCSFDPADPKKCGCGARVKEISTKGKYLCACGPGCRCNSVSEREGKSPCGVPMKKGG